MRRCVQDSRPLLKKFVLQLLETEFYSTADISDAWGVGGDWIRSLARKNNIDIRNVKYWQDRPKKTNVNSVFASERRENPLPHMLIDNCLIEFNKLLKDMEV